MTETLGLPEPAAEVQLVDTSFSLDHSDSVEILLLQWHTPYPADEHGIWRTAQANEIAEKRGILQAVARGHLFTAFGRCSSPHQNFLCLSA